MNKGLIFPKHKDYPLETAKTTNNPAGKQSMDTVPITGNTIGPSKIKRGLVSLLKKEGF